MRGAALLLALCAAGCEGSANISMSGGGVRTVTPLPAGTSVSGGTVRVSVQGGSSTGALIGLGVLAVSVFGEGGWDGVYRANPFIAIPPPTPAPELDRAPRQRAGLHQADRGPEREPEVSLI